MNINSQAIVFETPEKSDQPSTSAAVELTCSVEEDLTQRYQRLSVSEHLKTGILSIDRLHSFVHSNQLRKIEYMKLTLQLRNSIRDLFSGFDQDINDWIMNMESHATENGLYSRFIRDYISYEFLVQKEHSFAVLVLLNYIEKFKLSAETAFAEIFNISINDTFCSKCVSVHEDIDFYQENVRYLKKIISDDTESLDDSYLDQDYHEESDVTSDSDDDSDNSATSKKSRNKSSNIRASEKVSVNPFDDSVEDVYEYKDEEVLGVNPFHTDLEDETPKQGGSKGFNPQKMSSLKYDQDKTRECHICDKVFSTNYNMKLHLIQIHGLQVPNIRTYTCISCDFITGSRVLLIRHKETHTKIKSKKEEVVCRICNVRFANKSSLKRHVSRKHN